MNFLNLYYFKVTAEELSFTKAAKRLFISQQSLSNHISRLEKEFGVTLLHRTQPMTLTEAGHALYQSSQQLLDQKLQLEKNMQDLKDFHKGELVIGISPARSTVMMPEILPEFHETFPQIQIKLLEKTTSEINQALYEHRADLNISFAINDPERIHEDLLHTERLVCAVPNSFFSKYFPEGFQPPFSGTLQDFPTFANCPFISMPRKVWLGKAFEKCCQDHNISPEIVLETTSMSSLVALCNAGMGAIVLPEIFINQRTLFCSPADWRTSVSIYPLNYPAGAKSITISYLHGHYMNRAAIEFIKMAKKKFTY